MTPSATSSPTTRQRRWTSISSACRPIMPTSAKVFLSKAIQPETPEFLQDLRISREDIQLLKRCNMLSVM